MCALLYRCTNQETSAVAVVPWMVAVISWRVVDDYRYFLVGCGWWLLFPGGLWKKKQS